MTDTVADLRAFNRFHTRFSGALQPSYMESGMGLTAARTLYEIAQGGSTDDGGILAMELQDRLDIDSGYASRILRGFEKQGWIIRGRGTDARRRPIRLTDEGLSAFDALDRRTRADTEARIAGLDDLARERLSDALATIRQLLGDKVDDPWDIRIAQAGDLALIASRQTILYNRDYGWGRGMEILESEVTTAFLRDFKPGREQCWVARRHERMLGAVMVVDAGGGVAQLRLLHVEPDARGMGIGGALVDQCIAFARDAGYAHMRLWTHTVLEGARRIYERAGFTITSVEFHNHFGEPIQGETWEMPL
ncbi:MAG TPA: bifunctional helix-turn-helix transcriptional regulator/GNAT family N-acetyltransferase [Sphingobium sp.]